MSGVYCHVHASSTSACAVFTVQSYIEDSSAVSLFQVQMSRSNWKSRGEEAGTTVLVKVLYCKIKMVFFNFEFVS